MYDNVCTVSLQRHHRILSNCKSFRSHACSVGSTWRSWTSSWMERTYLPLKLTRCLLKNSVSTKPCRPAISQYSLPFQGLDTDDTTASPSPTPAQSTQSTPKPSGNGNRNLNKGWKPPRECLFGEFYNSSECLYLMPSLRPES